MTNYEKYFGSPENAAVTLSALQDVITADSICEQRGRFFRGYEKLREGWFNEYYSFDLGTAFYELLGAPLDGMTMDDKSTLKWLLEGEE